MNMPSENFQTTSQLMAARAQHVDNLTLLNRASKDWSAATAERGQATIANILRQIEDIDAELMMSRPRRGGAG